MTEHTSDSEFLREIAEEWGTTRQPHSHPIYLRLRRIADELEGVERREVFSVYWPDDPSDDPEISDRTILPLTLIEATRIARSPGAETARIEHQFVTSGVTPWKPYAPEADSA